MGKTWVVFKREYLERVRSRWFIITTVLGPVLMGILTILPAFMAAKTKVSVVVADDYRDRVSEVVEAARQAGLDVEEQLATIGLITGAIDESKRPLLERVRGVSAVEVRRTFQLPPPESDVQ